MKPRITILFALILTLLYSESKSQDYYSFPTENAQWNGFVFFYVPNMFSEIRNYHYIMDGDTIINSLQYQKIYLNILEDENDANYIGALREDENKNILFFPAETYIDTPTGHTFPNNTEEHLLYTFDNLSVGMDLPINEEANNIKVVSIDSVLIGETYRKSYQISNELLMSTEYWIEGIGSDKEFLSPFTYTFEWSFWTLCHTDDNNETFYINSPNGEDSCHYFINVGIKELNQQISLYPNPVTDILKLEFNSAYPGEIIILNLLGQSILSRKVSNKTMEIDLTDLKRGVYFLEIKMGEKRLTKKFIKK